MGFFTELVGDFFNGFQQLQVEAPGRIQQLCRELGWAAERDGDTLHLTFNVGREQRLVSIREGNDSLPLFLCLSMALLPPERVPPNVYGYLLNRNSELAVASWQVIERQDGMASFALCYRALGPGLNAGVFKCICTEMVEEATAFDQKMWQTGLLR